MSLRILLCVTGKKKKHLNDLLSDSTYLPTSRLAKTPNCRELCKWRVKKGNKHSCMVVRNSLHGGSTHEVLMSACSQNCCKGKQAPGEGSHLKKIQHWSSSIIPLRTSTRTTPAFRACEERRGLWWDYIIIQEFQSCFLPKPLWQSMFPREFHMSQCFTPLLHLILKVNLSR